MPASTRSCRWASSCRARATTSCAPSQAAAEHGLPIIPRGGGTSLSGQSIGAGLIIDFSKYMQRIEIDPTSRTARVQPGVVLDQLNAAAAPHGLQFGPDVATSSRANVGGMIGNNSAGARSIWHGKTVDNVIALDVVLSDGTHDHVRAADAAASWRSNKRARIWSGRSIAKSRASSRENRDEIVARFPPILRRVSGYNLDEFVPECRGRYPTPRLARRRARQRSADVSRRRLQSRQADRRRRRQRWARSPKRSCTCCRCPRCAASWCCTSIRMAHAVASVGAILSCEPSAAELLDGLIVRLAEKSLEYRNYLDFVVGQPESLVLVEFSGEHRAEVQAKVDELTEKLARTAGLVSHSAGAGKESMCDHVWACRKAALPLLLGLPGTRKPVAFVEDGAVAPEHLPRVRRALRRDHGPARHRRRLLWPCLGRLPAHSPDARSDAARSTSTGSQQISQEVCDLVMEFGGAMSGEHGDGLARSYLNERLFGPQLYQAFKQVKAAFDPAQPHESRQGRRWPQPGREPALRRRLSERWTCRPRSTSRREGGFARAVELCNGAGVCRKLQTGTMCPSFMVTRDEEHSTRGRANALRMVLSGALPPEELTGQRLFDTYDLCLECKGCKAECPSNVDVAKLKMEFLDGYYRRARRAAGRAADGARGRRSTGSARRWRRCRTGRRSCPARAGWPSGCWASTRAVPCPASSAIIFASGFGRRSAANRTTSNAAPRGPIVLLDDCLTSYCEPGVNRAAVQVLEAAGYEVHLAGLECCGRTFVSKGFLRDGQELARRNIEQLLPWAERGVPIVGCEPSCLLMLVDEYPDLVPGEAARSSGRAGGARRLAPGARGDRLAAAAARSSRFCCTATAIKRRLVGASDTQAALAMIPGAKVQLVDSGCCGMAGSFGYEHYDMSMAIGERVLFPAVRGAPRRDDRRAGILLPPSDRARHGPQAPSIRSKLHGADRR